MPRKAFVRITLVAIVLAGWFTLAHGATTPEDLLRGQLLASDQAFPTKWTSPDEYAARLKKLHQPTLTYDRSGKLPIEYAAFFATQAIEPLSFVVYDITEGVSRKVKKASFPTSAGKGGRALFGKYTLDQAKLPANRRYRLNIETAAGKALATGEIALR